MRNTVLATTLTNPLKKEEQAQMQARLMKTATHIVLEMRSMRQPLPELRLTLLLWRSQHLSTIVSRSMKKYWIWSGLKKKKKSRSILPEKSQSQEENQNWLDSTPVLKECSCILKKKMTLICFERDKRAAKSSTSLISGLLKCHPTDSALWKILKTSASLPDLTFCSVKWYHLLKFNQSSCFRNKAFLFQEERRYVFPALVGLILDQWESHNLPARLFQGLNQALQMGMEEARARGRSGRCRKK